MRTIHPRMRDVNGKKAGMDLKTLLVGIATIAGVLCTFATFILYGMSKIGEQSGGGVGEGKMIGCAIAAIACYGAAAYIGTQDLTIGV